VEVSITAKHSNVFYIYEKIGEQTGYKAVEKAKACKNEFGLDLFRYNNRVYEGRTGLGFITEHESPNLAAVIERGGGIAKQTSRSKRTANRRNAALHPPR
jgi:hypothetical protein